MTWLICPKDADRMANSVDCSFSATVFVQTCLSETFGSLDHYPSCFEENFCFIGQYQLLNCGVKQTMTN